MPRPLTDSRKALEFERCRPLLWLPRNARLQGRPLLRRSLDPAHRTLSGHDSGHRRQPWYLRPCQPLEGQLDSTLAGIAMYTKAKRFLVDRGTPREKVEAMPVYEALRTLVRRLLSRRTSMNTSNGTASPITKATTPSPNSAVKRASRIDLDDKNLFATALVPLPRQGPLYRHQTRPPARPCSASPRTSASMPPPMAPFPKNSTLPSLLPVPPGPHPPASPSTTHTTPTPKTAELSSPRQKPQRHRQIYTFSLRNIARHGSVYPQTRASCVPIPTIASVTSKPKRQLPGQKRIKK